MPKLKNAQHEEFCQQWIVDFNGARACFVAGGSKNKHVARVTACHWMARADIQKRIAELLRNRSERTQVTQDMVVKELAIPAFADFTDFAKYTKKDGLIIEETKKIKGEKTRAIKSMRQTTSKDGGSISIELHGKEKALELLGRHTGVFEDAGDKIAKVLYEISEKFMPKLIKPKDTKE